MKKRLPEYIIRSDKIGVNNVFYCFSKNKGIVFNANLKSLIRNYHIPIEVDKDSLDFYLTLGYVPASRTMIKGVYKIPPSFELNLRTGKLTKYWDLEFGLNLNDRGLAYYKEYFRENLISAVKRCLNQSINQNKIGVFISGGVDSTTTLAILKNLLKIDVRTFTAAFINFGESKNAQFVSKYFDTEHSEVLITAESALKILLELVCSSTDCFSDPACIPLWSLSIYAKEFVTDVFIGEGADDLGGGYLIYRMMRDAEKFSISDSPIKRAEKRMLRYISLLRDDFTTEDKIRLLSRYEDKDLVTSYLNPLFKINTSDVIQQMIYLIFKTYLPYCLLKKNMTMIEGNGIKLHLPFLDLSMIKCFTEIPSYYKINGDIEKFIEKETFRDLLPKKVIKRKKIGFRVPISEWIKKDPWKSFMEEMLYNSKFFNHRFIKEKINETRKGILDYSRQLYNLIYFELWLKKISR